MGRMILVPGADYSQANLGKVTPSEGLPIEGITINGPGAAYNSANYTAKLWPTFTTQRSYTWSIVSGGQYASIDPSTGVLSVNGSADSSPVTIRCTSADNPNIYTDKTVICSIGNLVYHDYLESDGSAYIRIPRATPMFDTVITARYILGAGGNGYVISSRDNRDTSATYGLYLVSNGTNSRVWAGSSQYTITSTNPQTMKHRAILHTSTTSTFANASFTCYNDVTDTLLYTKDGVVCYTLSSLVLFALPSQASSESSFEINPETLSRGKFYNMTIEKDDILLADYRAATLDGVPCLVDYVSGQVYYSATGSGLSVGDD